MNLADLGWSQRFREHFERIEQPGAVPARVACQQKDGYLVLGESGELTAKVSGRLRHLAASPGELPAVGDWVAIEPRPAEGTATIHAVLPRRSAFTRKTSGSRARRSGGSTEDQVVAANVDIVFLVSGLDGDFSPRRLERYLTVAWDSGAKPVVVLNKTDLCPDAQARVAQVEAIAYGVPIHPVSAAENRGLEALRAYLAPGKTVAFLGSSGVGKSTLINRLLGVERQQVAAVREDDRRGRHCTTRRELIPLPGGALAVDTPGMRELQPWADEACLETSFSDIEELATRCRFRDCGHRAEPGCAVKQALDDGTLDPGRYRNYLKLQKELRHLARRQDHKARLAEKAKWRNIAIASRKRNKQRWQ